MIFHETRSIASKHPGLWMIFHERAMTDNLWEVQLKVLQFQKRHSRVDYILFYNLFFNEPLDWF